MLTLILTLSKDERTEGRGSGQYPSLQAGGEPLVVDGPDLPRHTAGLLLAGGTDLTPHLYGERRARQTGRPNKPRDAHELASFTRRWGVTCG
jgi:hypothetical protein